MRHEVAALLASMHEPPPRLNVWQWAELDVDYRRVPSYDSQVKAAYDSRYIPIWKEPAECLTDNSVSEVVICKCSRAGASENVLLNGLRYFVACDPCPTLFVAGDEKASTRFFSERIKLGMGLSEATARKFASAEVTQHDVHFADSLLRCTWQSNRSAFRQSGYRVVMADEISTWEDYSLDILRRRVETYSFSKVVLVSSPDATQARPSANDPIFAEFEQTDRRYYFVPCPTCGKEFRFQMGSEGSVEGLKFYRGSRAEVSTPDGEWDFAKVEAAAHYRAPCGHVVEERDRLGLILKGRWVATNPNAPKGRRGYHCNAFLLPFKSSSFGAMATAFLRAKAKHQLRTFVYEFLAEPWADEVDSTDAEQLGKQRKNYRVGERFSQADDYKAAYANKESQVIVTADVQRDSLYCVAREWCGGDSGLIAAEHVLDFRDIDAFANKHNAAYLFVDAGYDRRRLETYEFCLTCRAIPLIGSDSLQAQPVRRRVVSPYEGIRNEGGAPVQLAEWTFASNTFASILYDLMTGQTEHLWLLPKDVQREYMLQVQAEECVNGKWQPKRGFDKSNHYFDAEKMQVVGAYIKGLYRPTVMLPGSLSLGS